MWANAAQSALSRQIPVLHKRHYYTFNVAWVTAAQRALSRQIPVVHKTHYYTFNVAWVTAVQRALSRQIPVLHKRHIIEHWMLHDLLQRTARVRSPPPGAACHLSRAPAACLRTLGLDEGGVVALQFIYWQRSYEIFPRRSSIILLISKFRGFFAKEHWQMWN